MITEHSHTNTIEYDTTTATILDNLLDGWQSFLGDIKHSYSTTADSLMDEILITLSQDQVNEALNTFVVKNVRLLLELRLELFDDSIRLYCTAEFLGMYLSVASNFRLVQVRLDRHIQRFTFEQIANTDIFTLHTKKWYLAPLMRLGIRAYRTLLRRDPLPFLLSLSPKIKGQTFIDYKGRFIYLDIGRYFNDTIKNYLKKVQINDGVIKKEQLILKAQPNFGEILSFGDGDGDVITAKDNPNKSP